MTKFYGKKNISVFITFIVACVFTCLFVIFKSGIDAKADDKLSEYKQIIFNQDSGLGTSEINCIYQTQSGYIWVGTDGGLYRYNGSEFRLFNLWNTDKSDVYYINDLYQDSTGSLWVSTNNYGLFRISGCSPTCPWRTMCASGCITRSATVCSAGSAGCRHTGKRNGSSMKRRWSC